MKIEENFKQIGYAWVFTKDGLIKTTKMNQECDLTKLKKFDMVKNFYKEEFSIFNIIDSEYTLTEKGIDKIENMETIGKKENLNILLKSLIEEIGKMKAEELSLNFPSEKCRYDVISDSLKKFNIIIENQTTEFNLEHYIETRNQLKYESSILTSSEAKPYTSLIQAFDAILYNEGKFKDNDAITLFNCNEKNDPKEYKIPYSVIVKSLNGFFNFVDNINYKQSVKKPRN